MQCIVQFIMPTFFVYSILAMTDSTFPNNSMEQNRLPFPPEKPPTRTMADLLFLSEFDRHLMNWLLRQQSASLPEISTYLNQDEQSTQPTLDELAVQGFVQLVELDGQMRYQPRLTSRRSRQGSTNLWKALE